MSSELFAARCHQLFDGRRSTYWESDAREGPKPHWVAIGGWDAPLRELAIYLKDHDSYSPRSVRIQLQRARGGFVSSQNRSIRCITQAPILLLTLHIKDHDFHSPRSVRIQLQRARGFVSSQNRSTAYITKTPFFFSRMSQTFPSVSFHRCRCVSVKCVERVLSVLEARVNVCRGESLRRLEFFFSCHTTHTTTAERRIEKQCRRRGASSGQKTRRGIEGEQPGRRLFSFACHTTHTTPRLLLATDREDASSKVTAGVTANTTVKNSRASRESGLCSQTVYNTKGHEHTRTGN